VLIALVTKGFLTALIVLAIVTGVMQLEGHVLQPFLLGRAVRLHPLAVVIAIACGVEIAGITGALLAVPVLAVAKTAISSLLHDPPLEPSRVNALRPINAHPLPDQPRYQPPQPDDRP
jgi:predicted PurR-regulated permease PerM